eukprot:CAMPEP_0194070258 /NCGR_PEP_ID=MMETSP0009_2-20130614/88083_1 /TAXON_ID=210454 /ORGANISM="Grammatophora oceanica, Strain CCMP 410" /LENGTH=44 /DNA_ID= /DNA_START= /DNA_END= /DNA_ORIENTATION=
MTSRSDPTLTKALTNLMNARWQSGQSSHFAVPFDAGAGATEMDS